MFLTIQRRLLNDKEKIKELRHRLKLGPLTADNFWLLQTLRTQFMLPPSTKAYNLSWKNDIISSTALKRDKTSSKLNFFIRKTFQNQSEGFFFEAGALDGEILSNTLWLEVKKKWRGILVEADPTNCDILKQKNRKAFISCTCVSPFNYAKEFLLKYLL